MSRILILTLILTLSCSKSSNSPEFDDTDIVEISGRFLNADNSAVANEYIFLTNYRYFAYYDPNEILIGIEYINWISYAFFGFPFVLFGESKNEYNPADYFSQEIVTDSDGYFSFQLEAGNLVRDAQGGINIVLVNENDPESESLGKYNFVIKDQATQLGDLILCDFESLSITQTANTIDFSWTQPDLEINHYLFKFIDRRDNSIVWLEQVEGTNASLSLAKTALLDIDVYLAIEMFYTFEEEFHKSCLSPQKSVPELSNSTNLAANQPSTASGIEFTITSLTNEGFNDPTYFSAFDVNEVVIDLGETRNFSYINLHNLIFESGESITGTIRISDEETFSNSSTIFQSSTLSRFLSIPIEGGASSRYIRLTFSSVVESLQEVSVQ